MELLHLDPHRTDRPHVGPPHGERAVRRLDAVAERRGERRGVAGTVGLEHERPIGERDELDLVSCRAFTFGRGDRIPFPLPLEPGDACREPVAARVEWHRVCLPDWTTTSYAASSPGASPFFRWAARRGSRTRLSR